MSFILRPQPVVRLAGLPASVLPELTFSDTSELVQRVLADHAWLRAEASALAELLHRVIGTAASDRKPRLVGLRRALYRMRSPAAAEWGPDLRHALPPEISMRVDCWLDRFGCWRRDRARLPEVLAAESRRKAGTLRRIVADPAFRRAVWQSSEPLAAELEKWLAQPTRQPRRQSLARLAKYVSRATTKTSPNSAFAVSGLGTWSGSGSAVRLEQDPGRHGVLELYGRLYDDMVTALLRQPGLWCSTAVRANPSVVERDGMLSFLGRPPAESLLTLPATTAVRTCLALAGAGPGLTLGELRDQLATGTEQTAPSTRFLSYLVEIGLLETNPPMSGHPQRAAGLASWVDTHGGDELADVAAHLRCLAADLTGPVPAADLARHRARQESLRGTFHALSARLGLHNGDQERRPPVAHDSVVCSGELARCGSAAWQPALTDLDLIRRWLAVFNPALPLRLALGEIWGTRLGSGPVPFLTLHRAVQEEVAAAGPRAAELRRLLADDRRGTGPADSQFARVRELRRLQDRAMQPLHARSPGAEVVHVDPATLADMAPSWPSFVEPIGSLACYAQPLPPEGEPGLVLNVADTGYGRGWSRLVHLLTLAGAEPAAEVATLPAGRALAELASARWSTLNDRVPSVPYEIDYPFTSSSRPSQQRLPLSDLMVNLDPERGLLRLHSTRLRRELTALALGLLATGALPPAARLLVQAFGAMPVIHFRLPVGLPGSPATPFHRPRLVAGRVVLRRASWLVEAAAVPQRRPGEADADYLVQLTGWLRTAGIPRRCFVRVLPEPDPEPGAWPTGKWRKPIYLDFDNWFLVLAFENMLRSQAAVVQFEEALPDPEAATDSRVFELLLELNGREV